MSSDALQPVANALLRTALVGPKRKHHMLVRALAQGADPNLRLEEGAHPRRTALVEAIQSNRVRAVEALLAAGAQVHGDSWDTSPLIAASSQVALKAIAQLLAAGANPNEQVQPTGDGPLHVLARSSWRHAQHSLQAVEQLTAAGADMELRNHRGDTPLFTVLREGRLLGITLLLQADANPWNSAPQAPGFWEVAVTQSAEHARWTTVEHLLRTRAVDPEPLNQPGLGQWFARHQPSAVGYGGQREAWRQAQTLYIQWMQARTSASGLEAAMGVLASSARPGRARL